MSGVQVKLSKRDIKKHLYVILLGIFFSFSAFRAIFDLQTSINIQDGVGSLSGFTVGGSIMLSSLTLVPILLKVLGPRKSIILCESCYLIFALANYYAVFPTMIPASVLAGLGEALVYPALSLVVHYCAREYSRIVTEKRMQHYVHVFTGMCFGMVYFTRVSGNAVSLLVMQVGKSMSTVSNSTEIVNGTDQSLQYCGANDCQDPNITRQNLSKYVASRTTTYALLSIFITFIVIAILIHRFGTKDIQSTNANDLNENPLELLHESGNKEDTEEFNDVSTSQEKTKCCELSQVSATLISCLRQLKNPKQILLAWIDLYAGLSLSFMTAEVTRAYVSCMMGVEKVGLAMLVFGTAGCLSSNLNGILAARFGRNVPLSFGFLLDLSVYIFILLWEPQESTVSLSFVVSSCLGFTSGMWQSFTNAIVAKYFKTNQEVAYSAWNMFFSIGIAVQFGWSPYLCVRTKIYITALLLCIAMALYGVAEFKYQRKPKHMKENTQDKTSSEPT